MAKDFLQTNLSELFSEGLRKSVPIIPYIIQLIATIFVFFINPITQLIYYSVFSNVQGTIYILT